MPIDVWLSADSPPQKGCHFLLSYAFVVQGMFGSWYDWVGWGGVRWGEHVPWHLHLFCVTVTTYAATLADFVKVCERKFDNMFIILFAKLAHALDTTLASGL